MVLSYKNKYFGMGFEILQTHQIQVFGYHFWYAIYIRKNN